MWVTFLIVGRGEDQHKMHMHIASVYGALKLDVHVGS